MKTRQNKIAPFLGAISLKPLQHPFYFFLLLSAVSLAITHWAEIELQQAFWLQWSVCLSVNILAISITNSLNRRLIPQIIQIRNIRNVSRAIATWVLALIFCSISMRTHESQYLALIHITTDIHAFPFLTGASMAVTALTVTAQLFLLFITIISPYRCIFTKEEI
ncbi:hypothetical protein E6B08_23155 [Pseudomonas putida]|uniref:Uncharacterized protein n=1 Tax=Pseudomonas putida TaxID=303 RepID=A0A4D6XML5_PSEPU|nr:hypothetical protein [Pseudomonas putida]QCI14065.1 hypothetical protein E6B08_23155 [Pseudomonas putida]